MRSTYGGYNSNSRLNNTPYSSGSLPRIGGGTSSYHARSPSSYASNASSGRFGSSYNVVGSSATQNSTLKSVNDYHLNSTASKSSSQALASSYTLPVNRKSPYNRSASISNQLLLNYSENSSPISARRQSTLNSASGSAAKIYNSLNEAHSEITLSRSGAYSSPRKYSNSSNSKTLGGEQATNNKLLSTTNFYSGILRGERNNKNYEDKDVMTKSLGNSVEPLEPNLTSANLEVDSSDFDRFYEKYVKDTQSHGDTVKKSSSSSISDQEADEDNKDMNGNYVSNSSLENQETDFATIECKLDYKPTELNADFYVVNKCEEYIIHFSTNIETSKFDKSESLSSSSEFSTSVESTKMLDVSMRAASECFNPALFDDKLKRESLHSSCPENLVQNNVESNLSSTQDLGPDLMMNSNLWDDFDTPYVEVEVAEVQDNSNNNNSSVVSSQENLENRKTSNPWDDFNFGTTEDPAHFDDQLTKTSSSNEKDLNKAPANPWDDFVAPENCEFSKSASPELTKRTSKREEDSRSQSQDSGNPPHSSSLEDQAEDVAQQYKNPPWMDFEIFDHSSTGTSDSYYAERSSKEKSFSVESEEDETCCNFVLNLNRRKFSIQVDAETDSTSESEEEPTTRLDLNHCYSPKIQFLQVPIGGAEPTIMDTSISEYEESECESTFIIGKDFRIISTGVQPEVQDQRGRLESHLAIPAPVFNIKVSYGQDEDEEESVGSVSEYEDFSASSSNEDQEDEEEIVQNDVKSQLEDQVVDKNMLISCEISEGRTSTTSTYETAYDADVSRPISAISVDKILFTSMDSMSDSIRVLKLENNLMVIDKGDYADDIQKSPKDPEESDVPEAKETIHEPDELILKNALISEEIQAVEKADRFFTNIRRPPLDKAMVRTAKGVNEMVIQEKIDIRHYPQQAKGEKSDILLTPMEEINILEQLKPIQVKQQYDTTDFCRPDRYEPKRPPTESWARKALIQPMKHEKILISKPEIRVHRKTIVEEQKHTATMEQISKCKAKLDSLKLGVNQPENLSNADADSAAANSFERQMEELKSKIRQGQTNLNKQAKDLGRNIQDAKISSKMAQEQENYRETLDAATQLKAQVQKDVEKWRETADIELQKRQLEKEVLAEKKLQKRKTLAEEARLKFEQTNTKQSCNTMKTLKITEPEQPMEPETTKPEPKWKRPASLFGKREPSKVSSPFMLKDKLEKQVLIKSPTLSPEKIEPASAPKAAITQPKYKSIPIQNAEVQKVTLQKADLINQCKAPQSKTKQIPEPSQWATREKVQPEKGLLVDQLDNRYQQKFAENRQQQKLLQLSIGKAKPKKCFKCKHRHNKFIGQIRDVDELLGTTASNQKLENRSINTPRSFEQMELMYQNCSRDQRSSTVINCKKINNDTGNLSNSTKKTGRIHIWKNTTDIDRVLFSKMDMKVLSDGQPSFRKVNVYVSTKYYIRFNLDNNWFSIRTSLHLS